MGIRTTKSRLGGQKTTHFFVSGLHVNTTVPFAQNFRASPRMNKVASAVPQEKQDPAS